MSINKRLINTGVEAAPAAFDALQNFETVTYTGNGGTLKVTGYIRKGAAFNGSSSKITLPSGSPFDDSNTIKSISGWIKADTTSSRVVLYSHSSLTNTNDYFYVGYLADLNRIYVAVRDGSSSNQNNRYVNITPNTNWNHIVAQLNGSTVEVWLNGVQQTVNDNISGSASSSSWIDYPTYDSSVVASIGISRVQSPVYSAGKIDQVRIFNTALNSTQVGQLAAEDYTDPKKSTTDYFGNGSAIALYELDEDANSSNFEQAAVFNGSDSRINTNDNKAFVADEMSISLWGRLNATGANENLISNWNSSGTRETSFQFTITSANKLELIVYASNDSTDYKQYVSNSALTGLTNWNHFSFTLTSGITAKLYVNGSEVSTTVTNGATYTSGTINTTGTFDTIIGAIGNASTGIDGEIDQVRIYSSALSSGDVTNLYNESSVPTANLVAHYKLDGNATDETGNYDGTETSITYSTGVYGGTPANVNFLGMAFKPDLIWFKNRDLTDTHRLHDSIRGIGTYLSSVNTAAELTISSGGPQSFDSNGFTTSSGGAYNATNEDYVAWCWRAAGYSNTFNVLEGGVTDTGSTASNVGITAGSNTNGWGVSANRDAGFSIVKYTGNGSNSSIGHGLNEAPELVIIKSRDQSTRNWITHFSSLGAGAYMSLNITNANATSTARINTTTSTVVNIGTSANVNANNDKLIMYCFHSVSGYSSIGSFVGDGSTDTVLNLGFEPKWIMIKNSDTTTGWFIMDSIRDNFAKRLRADVDNGESNIGTLTTSSTGITISSTSSDGRINGRPGYSDTMMYLAIA